MSKPSFTIGYHGCDAVLASQLLSRETTFRYSKKPFEWLGHGMYFWEDNFDRAKAWAESKYRKGLISQPAVIGAILNLRNCCDFSDKRFFDLFQKYHRELQRLSETSGEVLPVNYAPPGTNEPDRVSRNLDCSVIEYMHSRMQKSCTLNTLKRNEQVTKSPFDSVRGVFQEGKPVFEGSGIYRDTHIQICIRNPECIVGFFMPKEVQDYTETMEVQELPALFG